MHHHRLRLMGGLRALRFSRPTQILHRTYIIPPPPPSETPTITTFSDTSKPRPYPRPGYPQKRELPRIKSKIPQILLITSIALLSWSGFLLYTTNNEKLSSSVFKSLLRTLRSSPQIQETLGDAIRAEPEWYLNGAAKVDGRISTLQGSVDVSFRIKGTKGAGRVYFTSVRREKGAEFTILRFRVIADDGTVIDVEPEKSA